MLPPTVFPFDEGKVVRPKGHRRCFFVKLDPDQGGGYLAIKGTEPLLIDELLPITRSPAVLAREASMPAVDYLPIREHKVPMALTCREALEEVRVASALFERFVARYAEAPALPLPLAAFKWSDASAAAFQQTLSPFLSRFSEEIVDLLIRDGLGCFVYYYPVAPFPRVRDFRLASPEAITRPQDDVERWTRLFVRILALGYVPAVTTRQETGFAIQAQNTVVGGGFVDLDSLTPNEAITSDQEFYESYALAVNTLASTVAVYLFGEQAETQGVNKTAGWFGSLLHVHGLMSKYVQEELGRGARFDPRLQAVAPFNPDFSGLQMLAHCFEVAPDIGDLCRALDGDFEGLRAAPARPG
ncbi:MAG: hypothetical protein WBV82_23135 [Myxococcaceae bacterium]